MALKGGKCALKSQRQRLGFPPAAVIMLSSDQIKSNQNQKSGSIKLVFSIYFIYITSQENLQEC
jgi:hypothetical protein